MKTMTQLAGTCQAYPRLHAAGKTRRASPGPVVACVTARVLPFLTASQVMPPVLPEATVSSDIVCVPVVVFLMNIIYSSLSLGKGP